MLESYMKQITNCISSLNYYLRENQEQKKQDYCDKLEKTLELAIKFFKKYDGLNNQSFYFSNSGKLIYIFLLITNDGETKWQINIENKVKSFNEGITTEELVSYCWDKQVDIKSLITNLFNCMNQIVSKKKERMNKDIDKYNSEISCLNEAIENLQELVDTDIPEEIRNK